MLLNDESCGARGKRVLVTAEECCSPGLRNSGGYLRRRRLAAVDIPDAEDVSFAVGNGKDTVWRNGDGTGYGLAYDRLQVRSGKLCHSSVSESKRHRQERRYSDWQS